jgi:cobalt/nickel transport system permease protein
MKALCNHSLELTGLAGDPSSRVHRLDPRAKVVGLMSVTVVAVSAPVRLWPVYAVCAAVLAAYATAARIGPHDLWRRVRIVLPFVLVLGALVPFVRDGGRSWAIGPLTAHQAGLEVCLAVSAKAIIGTLGAALLGSTTTFPQVLRALEALRAPRLFVLIAAFMYRYLFVIVQETGRMRSALVARGYDPRHSLQAGPMGRMATAMFLRTYSRGERVYQAMLARGYDGAMPQLVPLSFGRVDVVFVAAILSLLLCVRLAAALA